MSEYHSELVNLTQLLWSTFDIAKHATVRSFVLIFPCMMPLEWLSWHLPQYLFPDDKELSNTYVPVCKLLFSTFFEYACGYHARYMCTRIGSAIQVAV